MTASNYLYLLAIGLVVIGWETRSYAEGDVTIYAPLAATTNAAPEGTLAPDGTLIIHKSLHKNTTATSETTGVSTAAIPAPTGVTSTSAKTTPPAYWAPAPNPVQTATIPSKNPVSFGPTVETGLPVARHSIRGDETAAIDPSPIPINATLPAVTSTAGTKPSKTSLATTSPISTTASRTVLASAISALPEFPSDASSTFTPKKSTTLMDDIPIPSSLHKGPKNIYPWKTTIITTIFWIGEGSTPISSTTNEASAWDEDWRSSNSGSDSPNDRSGYASGRHAATVNPFYVALPFNDLAFPDKANRWLPAGWARPSRNGKQVSACKDRWVEIKAEDGTGRTCYAQWEDVGPLRYDHAEYVFGSQRPDTYTRAGLDVSPAVAQYLNVNEKNRFTRWRFVDDEDVPPGVWLKYDEQAVLYKALHELKETTASSRTLPIQRASAPIDDSTNDNSNKKKVGAAKG